MPGPLKSFIPNLVKLKKSFPRIALGLFLTLFLALQLTGVFELAIIQRIDYLIYDARLKATMPGGIDDRIVILDVDEKSLANPDLGRWPWSRDRMAKITDTLFDRYQIKLLGFDVIWAEPDKSSGIGSLQQLVKQSDPTNAALLKSIQQIAPKFDFDARFAKSLDGRALVLGYYFNSNDDAREVGVLPEPVFFKEDLVNREQDFPERKGYGANLEKLVNAAPYAGHFNPTVDPDGVIRRVPLLAKYQDDYYESLSLAMYRMYLGMQTPNYAGKGLLPDRIPGIQLAPLTQEFPKGSVLPIEGITIGKSYIPVELETNVLVPFRGPKKSFRYISLSDVYDGSAPIDALMDKIVFIGTNAPGLADLRATSVGGLYPGVEVHANLLAGMLDSEKGAIKASPPWMLAAQFLLLIISGLILSILFAQLSSLAGLAVLIGSLSIAILSNWWIWSNGFALPMASELILIALLYVLNVAYGYFVESRQQRQMADLFGQYVPPELVEKMAEDPMKYNMASKKMQLTVLFADIVGFTSISEKLTPIELSAFVNEYLTEMSSIISQSGGTLDKYIGDAIMAFWGAPLENQNHANDAVSAALAMQSKLQELKKSYEERGWPKIAVGLGLSTGDMTVGDMGSKVRKAYTVMGDAVNLGSRLEGITRQYGVGTIVSEVTQAATTGILYRDIDRVRVKGKEEPITIYEPMGYSAQLDSITKERIAKWNQFINLYRAQNWDVAEGILNSLTSDESNCFLYQVYAGRIAIMKANPPGENWDGVTKYDTK
jgi:adenylate cyclase